MNSSPAGIQVTRQPKCLDQYAARIAAPAAGAAGPATAATAAGPAPAAVSLVGNKIREYLGYLYKSPGFIIVFQKESKQKKSQPAHTTTEIRDQRTEPILPKQARETKNQKIE